MGNKNKTVSFRIDGGKFKNLRGIADEKNLSLSSVFRDYVHEFISHDGHVEIVPQHRVREEASTVSTVFPLTVEVPKSFLRDHEQLELECEHLRQQLDEVKQHAKKLEEEVTELQEKESEMVRLEDVDEKSGTALILE